MLNSKQRSNLRSIASEIQPIGQIGKAGLCENMISSLSDALNARELIKITVLNNSDVDIKETGIKLAESLKAELVAVIGKKIILYRKSEKQDFEHIEF